MDNTHKNQHILSANFLLFLLGGILLLTTREEFIHRNWLWLLPTLLLTFHASLPQIKIPLTEKMIFAISLIFLIAFSAANFFLNSNQDALALIATFTAIWSLKKQRLPLWLLASTAMIGASPVHILLLLLLLCSFATKEIRRTYGSLMIACAAGLSLGIIFFTNKIPAGWNTDVMSVLKLSDSPAFWEVLMSFLVAKWVMLFPYFHRVLVGMIVAIGCLLGLKTFFANSKSSLFLTAAIFSIYAFPFQTSTWFLIGAFSLILLLKPQTSSQQKQMAWPWYAFLISRMFLLISLIPHGTDVVYYRRIANNIFEGQLPYLNFSVEYPPLALLPITAAEFLTRLMGQVNFDSYRLYHSLIYFLIEVAFFTFLRKIQNAGKISEASVWLYIAGGFILGDLLYDRLDLIFAITLALSIFWMSEKRFLKAAAFIYAGIFFKLVSVVLMPLLFILIISSDKETKEKWQQLTAIAAMGLGLVLICHGLFGDSYLGFLNYHFARGIQIESLWATLAYVVSPIYLKADYGAIHLYYASPEFLLMTMIVPLLALAGIYASVWIRRTKLNATSIRNWSFLIVLVFMVFGKVFSPQFLIWIVCLYPLGQNTAYSREKILNSAVMLVTLSMTWYCYRNYGELLKMDKLMWGLLLTRNLILVGWLMLLTWKSGLSLRGQGLTYDSQRTLLPPPDSVSPSSITG